MRTHSFFHPYRYAAPPRLWAHHQPRYFGVVWFATHTASSLLNQAYRRHISATEIGSLTQLNQQWRHTQPLVRRCILFNGHLTWITLVMIEILLNAGAHVEVTASPELVVHQPVLQALRNSGTPFLRSIPESKRAGYYDVVYDCGAGMRHLFPKIGMVELTHTNPTIYTTLLFPVISVNLSQTKAIETRLGTGHSLVRVLHYWSQQALYAVASAKIHPTQYAVLLHMLSPERLFADHRFMIFGYGQVGAGIAQALVQAGTPRAQIVIVEIDLIAIAHAQQEGYLVLPLSNGGTASPQELAAIRQQLRHTFAVITATGVKGAVSKHFQSQDFDTAPLLINMGTEDEFGDAFPVDRVLNQKKPANFLLPRPTELVYLDAIFTLYLRAIEPLLSDPPRAAGLHSVPAALDEAVLSQWRRRHEPAKLDPRRELIQTQALLRSLRAQTLTRCSSFQSCAPSATEIGEPHHSTQIRRACA